MRNDLQIHDPMIWTWKSHDLDQKSLVFFLIWTKKEDFCFWSGPKKRVLFFDLDQKFDFFIWSGSKIGSLIFDLDQKIHFYFLIWIKNWLFNFWSGSKSGYFNFDLDQKVTIFFLIWIKKCLYFIWSADQKYFDLGSKYFWSRSKQTFWSRLFFSLILLISTNCYGIEVTYLLAQKKLKNDIPIWNIWGVQKFYQTFEGR